MFRDPVTSIVNTVYEGQQKEIYDKEEKQLFNISHDLKILLESMEQKEDESITKKEIRHFYMRRLSWK